MKLSYDEMEYVHFFCSMIELISRKTNNRRADIINYFTLQDIAEELELAEVNRCLPVSQVFDEYLDSYNIETGSYTHDPKTAALFTYSQIGKILQVYAAAKVENQGCDLAFAVKEVLSGSLNDLFAGME